MENPGINPKCTTNGTLCVESELFNDHQYKHLRISTGSAIITVNKTSEYSSEQCCML